MELKGLYVIADAGLRPDRSPSEVVRAALEAGVRIVQLRDKKSSSLQLMRTGEELRTFTREAGGLFFVNDRCDIALAVEADGVHLGPEDLPVALVRRMLGKRYLLGSSVATIAEAMEAEKAGADYVSVGAIYATQTKADAGEPVGVERIQEIAAAVRVPVAAIGGITADRIPEVVRAGADMVAVISAIACAEDMREATRHMMEQIEAAKRHPER